MQFTRQALRDFNELLRMLLPVSTLESGGWGHSGKKGGKLLLALLGNWGQDDGLFGFDILVNVIWRVLSCEMLSVFKFAEASQFSKS
jgi:hypothetical protein